MKAGDRIVVAPARSGQMKRTGEILEVLASDGRTHYRVRWSDGHESLFFPAAGTSMGIVSAKGKQTKLLVKH